MSQPCDDRQKDLLRPFLDDINDLGHPLARLAREIDWGFLDRRFRSVCRAGPGQPPLPMRLVAGLLILKHTHDMSGEVLCARWLENPYYQFFCGEERHPTPRRSTPLSSCRSRSCGANTVGLRRGKLSSRRIIRKLSPVDQHIVEPPHTARRD